MKENGKWRELLLARAALSLHTPVSGKIAMKTSCESSYNIEVNRKFNTV